MSAVVEGFVSDDLMYSFISDRVAVSLSFNADFEACDLCHEAYLFLRLT